jgi:hypothetical protein
VGNPPTGPSCSIGGVDSVCAGGSVRWCGPTGDYTYAWSGPGGFGSSSACVDVSAAGTYTLTLSDPASGVAGDPCTLTLRVIDCSAPHESDVCPRTARWWTWGCSKRHSPIAPDAFARVAAGVDQRSALWDFGGTAEGLCSLFERRRHATEMSAAKRHYAAVLANLTAAGMGITDANGQTIGIDPNHAVNIRGVPAGTTVGSWAAAAEQSLLSMAATNGRGRNEREACKRLCKQAKEINAGARSGACFGQMSGMSDDDDDDLVGEPDNSANFTAGGSTGSSGPFSGPSRTRWTLLRASHVELAIVDVTGRSVRHLVSGVFAAGTHEFVWDGRDDDGRSARPGAYFMAGTIGGDRASQRLILLH